MLHRTTCIHHTAAFQCRSCSYLSVYECTGLPATGHKQQTILIACFQSTFSGLSLQSRPFHVGQTRCREDRGITIASVTPGDTNVFRLCLLVRVHPKILQFDFIPFIIILFGKHNAIGSQKNYRAALQKTNNLLALCLSEQHSQPARNHPF